TSIEALYKKFYAWLGEPALFKWAQPGVYEYSDVYPLIYFKMQIEGAEPFDEVKHLVIDEMQDYTPVQYTVLSQLFHCKKTILGDAWQSVNPISSSNAEAINEILPAAQRVYLNKSYRSTIQISNLAQRINRNENLVPIERHGEEPGFHECEDHSDEMQRIRELLGRHIESDYKSLGIVCKTQEAAARVYEAVKDLSLSINLIDPTSTSFSNGITIATAHLAKGLEFDEVILPFCDDETYNTAIDRHMLYVGCTRAMHRLSLTFSGKLSLFLAN
ncbi:MAG TPA: 3'-5' exonuclease, partial [Opitutaceae bacterium]|nr:3'-5' exonuclease [Opitutaceae bacterium]